MKITVKPNVEKNAEKIISDLEPGTIFKLGNGVIALKIQRGEVLLLKYSSSGNWFEIHDGSMNHYGIEILGQLDEIIVK